MNCPHCKATNADDARFCGTCGHTLSATESSNPKLAAQTGEAPSLIGREIAGRYRVQVKLGEGGMGAVYKAEQISLKRQVAVKLLRPEVAGAQMLLQRFNAEAQVVAKLSHPNTVNIYDFGQDSDGTLFIAMEFIEGKSLRTVIHHEAPLPLRRALAIAAQVAASLTDAHSHGIVHRDLKPDNVMLQDRGRQKDVVRVLDFGIAKLRDENRQSQFAMTQAGDMLGTPQYMSPEQIRGEAIDGRTDIYSLGGMLYEMVTGRLPFEAPTVMALLSKHLLETIIPPSQRRPDLQLPPAVDALILGAMAKDAAQRPQSMEAFGEQINALLATFPPESGATAQGTAQVAAQSGGMTRPQAVATPPAFSAAATSPQAFVPHAPPPPGMSFAATAAVGPPPGGAPYNPYPATPAGTVAPAAQPKSGGGKGIYVLLGLIVAAGIGTGAYFALAKNGGGKSGTDTKDPGSNVAQTTSDAGAATLSAPIDAAQLGAGDDPWQKGGGTTIVPPIGTKTPESGGDDDDDDTPRTPTPTPTPRPQPQNIMKGMPAECEEYARTIEALSRCSIIPKQSRDAMLQAVKQMRQGYGNLQMTPQIRKQVADACAQGNAAIKQSMSMYNCQ